MKIMIRLAVCFYMTFTLVLGCLVALFLLRLIPLPDVTGFLSDLYQDAQLRMVGGIVVGVILCLNYIFSRAIMSQQQKGKMIAFDNPSGRVSVSLSAMEDLVKREIASLPEVKEVRSVISAGRKGLEISARLVLNADVNIPEMTSGLQDMVKSKIQDTIGIEEPVVVKVEVVKINPDSPKRRRQKDKEKVPTEREPAVPFHGYRA